MPKTTPTNLDEQLKEIQTLLAKPDANVLGRLGYYLNFLSPLGKTRATQSARTRPSSTKIQKHNGVTWIDIENPTRREINELTSSYPFHSLHLEDSLLTGQSTRLEKEDTYLFLLLHLPVFGQAHKLTTSQVGIFFGQDYLITIHWDSAALTRKLFLACEQDAELRDAYFRRSSGYLLYNVIEGLLSDLALFVQAMLQELDAIEERVFDTKAADGHRIGQLRKKISRLTRTTDSLKTTLADLTPHINDLTGENLSRYYKNISRIVSRLSESLEEAKETVEIYKDADFTASTEKTNEILALLTLIFTLTIPATVIGTFYGMNVLIPGGLQSPQWTFLGHYTTFNLIIIASLVPVLLMLWYFRKKDWF